MLVTFNDKWDSWLFGCNFINNCARTKIKCVLELTNFTPCLKTRVENGTVS